MITTGIRLPKRSLRSSEASTSSSWTVPPYLAASAFTNGLAASQSGHRFLVKNWTVNSLKGSLSVVDSQGACDGGRSFSPHTTGTFCPGVMDSLPARPTVTTSSYMWLGPSTRRGPQHITTIPTDGVPSPINRGGTLRPATAIIIVILLVIIAVAGIFQLVQILNA